MLIALYDALPTPSQKLPEKPLPPELHPQLGASPGAVPGSIPTALSLSALAAHCLTQTYDETRAQLSGSSSLGWHVRRSGTGAHPH